MLNLTTAIYGRLAGSTLATAINSRMFKGQAPEGTTYPYVVFFVITNMPEKTFSEDFEDTVVQFSLFSTASSTLEIENLYSYLKTLYDEVPFSVTGSTLVWMRRGTTVFQVEDHTTPTGTQRVWTYHVDFDVLTSLD